MRVLIFILMCSIALVDFLQSDFAVRNLAMVRILAQNDCARSYVIVSFNEFGGIGLTLPFWELRGMGDGMERLKTFYTWRPYLAYVRIPNVPKWPNISYYAIEIMATPETIDYLLAFVKTIEKLDFSRRIQVVNCVGPSGQQQPLGEWLRK